MNNDFQQHWQAGGTGVDRMINCFQVTAAISANIVGRGRKKTQSDMITQQVDGKAIITIPIMPILGHNRLIFQPAYFGSCPHFQLQFLRKF